MSNDTRKQIVGIVSSAKMDKSAVVKIERSVQHKLFAKPVGRTKKVVAHDKNNICGKGDKVLIEQTRPLSKTKRWRVVEIVEKYVGLAGD
ncbi:MAG: 30S ribosomal protein S17 [Candidatus Hydrogenedentes bacterium]|nr:30S ribosomal protein S17 [Candidatus Hydrogenedentota bacterium]